MTQGVETPYVSSMLTQKFILFSFVFDLFMSFLYSYEYMGDVDSSKKYKTKEKNDNKHSRKEPIDPKSIDPLCVWCFSFLGETPPCPFCRITDLFGKI
jgi:hypothetical protein